LTFKYIPKFTVKQPLLHLILEPAKMALPIPIIIPALEDDSHQQTFQINLEELESMLCDPRIADKKVNNLNMKLCKQAFL
jgi:hypothetical protein